VQRMVKVAGTEEDQLRRDAVQAALERAATVSKLPMLKSRPSRAQLERANTDERDNMSRLQQFDKDTVIAAEEAQQASMDAVGWGITASATLKMKSGRVRKGTTGQVRQGGKAKLTAAATLSNDSRKTKQQEKQMKALTSQGLQMKRGGKALAIQE
jgi:hypothetical protein